MAGARDVERCVVDQADVAALIGLCAVLEGHLTADRARLTDLSRRLGGRLAPDVLTGVPGDERAVRQAINDLNHRLRYALGEYPDPPATQPVPE